MPCRVASVTAPAETAASRSPGMSYSLQTKIFAYGLVLPVVLLLIGLVAYPFFYAIYVSFTDRVIGNDGHWIGFGNFRYLAGTASFGAAIVNTIDAGCHQRRAQARASASGSRSSSTSACPAAGSSALFSCCPGRCRPSSRS